MPKLSAAATRRLTMEFSKLTDEPVNGITARPIHPEDFSRWEFAIVGPEDSPYQFGVFTGILEFPEDYPLHPPKMFFSPPITHPNVYSGAGPTAAHKPGEVCISILHAGVDVFGYERPEERWSPAQTVRSILLSVFLMLKDVNVESPADVDAASLYSKRPDEFRRVVKKQVERSLGLPSS